jgi:hypothetical protein
VLPRWLTRLSCRPRKLAPGVSAMYGISSARRRSATLSLPHSAFDSTLAMARAASFIRVSLAGRRAVWAVPVVSHPVTVADDRSESNARQGVRRESSWSDGVGRGHRPRVRPHDHFFSDEPLAGWIELRSCVTLPGM